MLSGTTTWDSRGPGEDDIQQRDASGYGSVSSPCHSSAWSSRIVVSASRPFVLCRFVTSVLRRTAQEVSVNVHRRGWAGTPLSHG
jgi:RNA:NAD 2'-phosphotransferase (TPT1/KptA family)